jgi:TetR/AcrR family transcriptional regulator
MTTPLPNTLIEVKKPRRRSRIRVAHEEKILANAEFVFASYGYTGATIEKIAKDSGISKQNLLYYFSSKQELYQAVLKNILVIWLDKLNLKNQVGDDPAEKLSQYIRDKLKISQTHPNGSKVFANEIINGAPHIGDYLKRNLNEKLQADVDLVNSWIAEGKVDVIDPYHLFFMIWSSTQTYADFSTQIQLVLNKEELTEQDFNNAGDFLCQIILKGIGLK